MAKNVSRQSQSTQNVFGSIPYLAPERLAENRVDVQSDLWSVGVVLYEMIAGALPFFSENLTLLERRILHGSPDPLPAKYPLRLRQILARCLERAPTQRYPDATALREDLESFLRELQGTAQTRRTDRAVEDGENVPAPVEPEARAGAIRREPSAPFLSLPFQPRARAALQKIQERLQSWYGSVPGRARRFHALTSELEKQIQQRQSSWQLWIEEPVLRRLEDRVNHLHHIVEPLSALLHEADLLAREVQQLASRSGETGDRALGLWLRQQCKQWEVDLEQLGTELDREIEIRQERQRCSEIASQVRLLKQAIFILQEGEHALSLLGPRAQTVPFAATLPVLRRELISQKPTSDSLRQILGQLEPLQALVLRIKHPPPEVQHVVARLSELRGWSQELGELAEQVDRIEQWSQRFSLDGTEPDDLLREIAAHLEQLAAGARESSRTRFAVLRQQVDELVRTGGEQPELERQLAELAPPVFESVQAFRDWRASCARAEESCRVAAVRGEAAIAKRLARLTQRLRKGVQALQQPGSSYAVRLAVDALALEVAELARSTPKLQGLLVGGDLERRLKHLARRAGEDREVLARQGQDLMERTQEIQFHASSLGLEFPDLSGELSQTGGAGFSEPSPEAQARLEEQLNSQLQQLRRRYRERLDEQIAEAAAISAVLQSIEGAPVLPPSPALTGDFSLSAAAQALDAATALARRAREGAEQALVAHERQRQEFAGSLRRLDRETLRPAEREEVEQLLRDLEDTASSLPFLERLAGWARQLGIYKRLTERLQAEERAGLERLSRLRCRWQQHEVDALRRLCPELTERVESLVFGIPRHPRHWSAVHEQLGQAEQLLSLLESQSARLAASELDRAVTLLQPDSRESSSDGKVAILLRNLAQYTSEVNPPADLRQQIVDLAHWRFPGEFP